MLPDDLKKLTSITSVQTRGVRNFAKTSASEAIEVNMGENNESDQKKWSSIAGKTRKQRLALLHGYASIYYYLLDRCII